jgi:hypothetical protein
VWAWLDEAPLETLLAYDPTTNTTDTGPWPTPTCLIGTGPFIFDYYSPANMTAEAHRNPAYFRTAVELDSLLEAMFHACGDVNRDGVVWAADQNAYALAFGAHPSEAHWNPDADLNQDDRVNWMDGALIAAYFGDKRDHP